MYESLLELGRSETGFIAEDAGELGFSAEDLRKALSVGDGDPNIGNAVSGALGPLMPEDLSNTMTSLTFKKSDVWFYMALRKQNATNVNAEYTQLLSYGDGTAAFTNEDELPGEENSTYRRETVRMKFIGTTRRLTLLAQIVKTVGISDATAAENVAGSMYLSRVIESACFYGDSTLIPQQFDGLQAQLRRRGGAIYDARSDTYFKVEVLSRIVEKLVGLDRNGEPNTILCSLGAKTDLATDYVKVSNQQTATQRTKAGESDLAIGLRITTIVTQHGDLALMGSKFIRESKAPVAAGIGSSSRRPLPPVKVSLTSPAAPAGTSKFTAGDAGDYVYSVAAGNRWGISAPTAFGTVTVSADDETQLVVKDGGQDTTYYIVYRSLKDGTDVAEIARITRSAAQQTLLDRNATLPFTSIAFVLSMAPEYMVWRELMPLTKLDLARLDPTSRWMLLQYGALQIMAPTKQCLVINLGRDPNLAVLDDNDANRFVENWVNVLN